jgi:hypothetical protein
MVDKIVESTILAILLFWVLTNAGAFSSVANSIASATVGGVHALWGA